MVDADEVVIYLAIATNFNRFDDTNGEPEKRVVERLQAAKALGYEKIRERHRADYQSLFDRVALDLGGEAACELPTDQRLERGAQNDPQLAVLYFQYGRYLLISSSRVGTQPANLQGIWNDKTAPPWDSKWTININAQMNYWPAETTGLSELHTPLFALIRDLSQTGRHTARVHYGARGWMAHHNTDLWRATAPIDGPQWGMWPTGGAWLCTHLWEHFQFTGDREFLREFYPVMREASLFFMDALAEHPQFGYLVTCPSLSPEHGGLVAGPQMDTSIIRDLWTQTLQAGEILGKDDASFFDAPFFDELRTKLSRLAPYQVGQHRQLQEWLEDKDDPTSDHRHVSHLYAVFPSNQITPASPELFEAARHSLNLRGDGGTGWSKAWKINFWARFLDGDRAHKMLCEALDHNTYPNLFDAHPPFQIDGNFGGTSGIAEMLLQSQNGELHLLPALPTAWKQGEVRGLRTRGGFEVSLKWRDGALDQVHIQSIWGQDLCVRTGKVRREFTLPKGGRLQFSGALRG